MKAVEMISLNNDGSEFRLKILAFECGASDVATQDVAITQIGVVRPLHVHQVPEQQSEFALLRVLSVEPRFGPDVENLVVVKAARTPAVPNGYVIHQREHCGDSPADAMSEG